MRLKFFMLLMCVCLSVVNQECLSGGGGSKLAGDSDDGKDYQYPRLDYYCPEPRSITMVKTAVQPSSNDAQEIATSKNKSKIIEEVTASGEEKEEKKDSQPTTLPLPGTTALSSDSENGNMTVGFHLPPSLPFVYSAKEDNLYMLLIYPSLSRANHPDVLEVDKLSPLDADGLERAMKWLKHDLEHWGKQCDKIVKATDMYKSIDQNKSGADFIKIGLNTSEKRIKVLIKNRDGKVLLLGVPNLSVQ